MSVSVAPEFTPALPSRTAQESLNLVRELFGEASSAKKKLIPRWNRYERLTNNDAWSPFRASWLPSPSSSEVFPALHHLVAMVTSQRPIFYPAPYLPGVDFQPAPELLVEKGEQMEQVIESWWTTARCTTRTRMSCWDALKFGAGIQKTGWDPSLFDGLGNPTLSRVDPYNFLPDPNGSSMEDVRYVCEASEVAFYEILLRFPKTADRVKKTTTGSDLYLVDKRPQMDGGNEIQMMGQLAPINRTGEFPGTASTGQSGRYQGAGYSASDMTERVRLIECWVRQTDRVKVAVPVSADEMTEIEVDLPTWRFIAIANGQVLADMDNPLPHGRLPYIRIPYVETGEFWPLPLTEHIDKAQVALNRLLAALQMNLELAGNPILVDSVQSGLSRTRITGNRPGGRLTEAQPGTLRWLSPPGGGQEMLAAIQQWRESIDRTVGLSGSTRGEALRRREPAQAVDTSVESAQTRIGDFLSNLESAFREVGTQTANTIAQFYVEPRQLPLQGPGNKVSFMDIPEKCFYYPQNETGRTKDHRINFEVWVEAGSSLPLSHQARVAEVLALYQQGLVDAQAVHEVLRLPGWKQIVERMAAQPAPQPQAGG